MKRSYATMLSVLFIVGVLAFIYYTMMPQQGISNDQSLASFSIQRALLQIKNISAEPHYTGSENHQVIVAYLQKELQKLGLETKIQEGTTFSDWGNLVKSKNIIARIKGSDNSKALLLLSHYDSAPHSYSHGASDNGTGVATILEGLRAYLYNKTPHKNDIIILFSDAEELGLNGAALFVTQHAWAKDVGLALNFEARGTSGPSYMLMEVNKGNAAMVNGFANAHPNYPVTNSLMYSIYKMLPNDTDLTVFREQGKIQGFNFAFIDGHFNYHTAQDDFAHINPATVAHQGTYLMPLLSYFANADLTKMNSADDCVYFNAPFYFLSYPFHWIVPMWIGCTIIFLLLIFVGISKRVLNARDILRGLVPLFGALLTAGLTAFLGWKILLAIYPQYKDILQGFTYNGHDYIAAFVFLSLAIGFAFYSRSRTETAAINQFIAPLLLWIVINLAIAIYLPGAGFFIIPLFFGLLMLAYFILTQRINKTLNLILTIPSLVILVPFVVQFPVGLGLKILAGSAALTILIFTLLLPVFGTFSKKRRWATLMLLLSIGFFAHAHSHSTYKAGEAKPNSLNYILDAEQNKAFWVTYDVNVDEWTKTYLGNNPKDASNLNNNPFFSKYNSGLTLMSAAPIKNLAKPTIDFIRDTIIGNQRYLDIKISPNRKVNRYDVFANENIAFYNLKANGAKDLTEKSSLYKRNGRKLLSYYVVDNEPLELQFNISKAAVLDMDLSESSFNLMSNPLFQMAQRKAWMMPKPFVLTDAIIIQQKLKPTIKIGETPPPTQSIK